MKGLRKLDIDGGKITDAGLKEVAKLKDLQELKLSYLRLTAAGLRRWPASRASSDSTSRTAKSPTRG